MLCTSKTKFPNSNTYINCGQCKSCRINTKIEWKTKLLLEQKYYQDNIAFITLTYSNENLLREHNYGIKYKGGTLFVPEAQKFIKRFRKNYYHDYPNTEPKSIRYFMVGEYGSAEKTERAHYHVIIFGVDPERAKKITSKSWTKGTNKTLPVNKGAMDYVAGYTMKKMTSPKDFPDGREPEFSIKSANLGHCQIPALAKQLVKHDIVPGSNSWETFMLEQEQIHFDIFNGICGSKFHLRLDAHLKEKLKQYMLPEMKNFLQQKDDKFVIYPKSFKFRQEMQQVLSHGAIMSSRGKDEKEKSRKKSEKIFRRASENQTL